MENFESQQFRDELAREIGEAPKEQRRSILETAQGSVEYWIARQNKIKKFKEEDVDTILSPDYLQQSLDKTPWTHNKPGSLLLEKFDEIAKNTGTKRPEIINQIIPILDIYRAYPKAVGVILCALVEGARHNHEVNKEIEIFKTNEAVNIITAFESRLVGEEAHQISRVMELSIYKKGNTLELLPKYRDAVLSYLDAPIFAEYLARDILYGKSIDETNKLLDFYLMNDVKTELIKFYEEKYAFNIGLRKLIFEKGKENDWLKYFETEFERIDDILAKAQTLDDLAEAYTKLQEIYYIVLNNDTEWSSKNYLRFAVDIDLLEEESAKSVFYSIRDRYYILTGKLKDRVSAEINLPEISQTNEAKLEKIILEKIIDIPENTTRNVSFNWDKRMYEGKYRFQNGGGAVIGLRLDSLPESLLNKIISDKRIDKVEELKRAHEINLGKRKT